MILSENSPLDIYNQKKDFYADKEKSLKRKLNWLSFFRFFVFLFALILFYAFFANLRILSYISLFAGIIAFALLLRKYSVLEMLKDRTAGLCRINENEIKAMQGDFSSFYPGDEYIDHGHSYSFDLDLFGAGSIFQYLDRTCTCEGNKLLAQWLTHPSKDKNEIISRQNAVADLSEHIDWRQNFEAIGNCLDEKISDKEEFIQWLSQPSVFLKSRFYRWSRFIIPAITFAVIVLAACSLLSWYALLLAFLFQLFIAGRENQYIISSYLQLGKKEQSISKYHYLAEMSIKGEFTDSRLCDLQKKLNDGSGFSLKELEKLEKILHAFEHRNNMIAGFLLNGFLLWDIQCVLELESWRGRNRLLAGRWFDEIAEFDALSSLANFRYNHPDYVFPQISTETPVLDVRQMGHPLLDEKVRVCNDFGIESQGQFAIITGANMAGKSTFLRTIGVNLILAMAGAPVCAKKFLFKPLDLFTSMRTTDSLTKNESYFYAELKRLKELIGKLENGEKIFIVLDEILKGTNSTDKQAGSKAILEKLIRLKGVGIIATHDLSLTDLQKKYPQFIQNRCFEIEINGAQIYFDYLLKEGITRKMNAMLLMQQMGLVSSLS